MKNKILKLRLAVTLVFLFNSFSFSAPEDKKFQTLDNITVSGNTVSMETSGQVKYNVFKMTNPPKLVIELAGTEHNVKNKELLIKGDVIKAIRSGQYKNEPVKITRVVIDLGKMVEYELKGEEKKITLTYKTGQESVQAARKAPKPAAETASANAVPAAPAVVPASPKTAKRIRKSAPAALPTAEVAKSTDTAATTTAAVTPENETVAAPAVAASVPVAEVNPLPAPQPVKKRRKKTAFKPAQAPPPPANQSKQEEKQQESIKSVSIPSTPVTLDFESADIRDVLRVLSMKSGINIIHGEDVAGSVTLHLENVPFNKAFETILSLNGLVMQEQGPNILRITTPQKISEERSLAVNFTKVFALNYAKAEEVKSNLDAVRNAEGRKGYITVDSRTNSLVVTDTPEGLSSVEKLIYELDKKPQQVLIEAKIVEVNLTNSFDMGIQWQFAGNVYDSGNTKVNLGKSEVSGTEVTVNSIDNGGTGVAFPAAASGGQQGVISFGIIANNTYLTGALSALSQKGLSKILSTPRVTTINNKEAKILVGQKIPYSTTTLSNGVSQTSTQFLDVGIKLTVTPTINVDRKITLQVHPEVSLYVRADPSGPVLGNREAQTTVIIGDEETIVIGGLITEQDIKLGTQVPLLGDLPVLGHLFRRDSKSKERTELLVFITPKIID